MNSNINKRSQTFYASRHGVTAKAETTKSHLTKKLGRIDALNLFTNGFASKVEEASEFYKANKLPENIYALPGSAGILPAWVAQRSKKPVIYTSCATGRACRQDAGAPRFTALFNYPLYKI